MGKGYEAVKKGWQFLSRRWWVVHFLGFALVYTAGRLTAALMKGRLVYPAWGRHHSDIPVGLRGGVLG
jgi:hypothetical protein